MMTLLQALDLLPGARLVGDGTVAIARVHSDTRSVQVGDLFVALQGDTFDANTLLAQAQASGAVAALCHRGYALPGLPCIEVADTLAALGTLASGWRAQFRLPLIAVTGSNGKTTVTQMVASILRAAQPEAFLATQGNYNNAIGVPLTLLRLRAHHRLAVVELGMNHPGEIALLAAMARPTVALVNNAQREHLEFMQTVEAVAHENGSVLAALPTDGVAVFPAEDSFSTLWHSMAAPRRCLQFAVGVADVCADAPVWAEGAWQVHARTSAGPLDYALHIAGLHNVTNSLAAAACALAAGVPLAAIAQGLAGFEPVKGRSKALAVHIGGRTLTVVDDSYNANPDSVQAAIAVLAALPGPRLLVLGDMGEVGDQGPQFHAEAGAQAQRCGIEQILTLGPLSAHLGPFGGQHFDTLDALLAAVHAQLPQVASVLVKGSRFMQMERVVAFIQKQQQQQHSEDSPRAA
ncbi:UDP-N-acetylmuramoyl-tripeptide--D-alanyl-D-alanine ligase [Rhodoferax sp. WC2427]|uniref:UDP-N-acetylmuramoyl-tripeptide--D-alanyl-D- alanine ligase n=1 Tax=Rhodoferax sp. WC2427 TaxID=3234144 RepID=UPI003465DB18